jgi:signal peptidase I
VVDARDLIARRMRAEQRAHLAREAIETILLTALIFFVVHFAVQTFKVNGPSMEPGLQDGQYLIVNSVAYLFGQPSRGDVIVFHHHHIPADAHDLESGCTLDPGTNGKFMSCDYVKRVIAVPGDTVQITPSQVIVDGVPLNEPYVNLPPGAAYAPVLPPEKIGYNQFFVLGDNRMNSSDSRYWGPVPRQDIVGRVVMIFWPLNQMHWLPGYSNVFSRVKQ